MKQILIAAAIILSATLIYAQATQEWVQSYPGALFGIRNRALALDNPGNIYVTGKFNDGITNSTVLQKYDASGNLLWIKTHLPAGSSSASALTNMHLP